MRTPLNAASMTVGAASTAQIVSLSRDMARAGLLLFLAGCNADPPPNAQEQPSDRPPPAVNEINAQAAADQFKAGDSGLEGLTRLTGSEVRRLAVGRTLSNRGPRPLTHRMQFQTDGVALIFLDNIIHRDPYRIVGDALCTYSENRWYCRRFYRDADNQLFVLFAADRNEPIPVSIE